MFLQVDKSWKEVMRKVNRLPNALRAATQPGNNTVCLNYVLLALNHVSLPFKGSHRSFLHLPRNLSNNICTAPYIFWSHFVLKGAYSFINLCLSLMCFYRSFPFPLEYFFSGFLGKKFLIPSALHSVNKNIPCMLNSPHPSRI